VNPDTRCEICSPSQAQTRWSAIAGEHCASAITAGFLHTCAIVNGAGYCWALYPEQQLGYQSTDYREGLPCSFAARQVSGLGAHVQDISAGTAHSCAVMNGAAYCWGWNGEGQLGDGTTLDSATPVLAHGLSTGVSAISAGAYHTCAIAHDMGYCWGRNLEGQLGIGTNENSLVPVPLQVLPSAFSAISAGYSQTCAIVMGRAYCWGGNAQGELGNDSTDGSNVPVLIESLSSYLTDITAGVSNSCAYDSSNVYCWGDSTYLQLGSDTCEKGYRCSRRPVIVPGLQGSVVASSLDWAHLLVATTQGTYAAGHNDSGQLGDGTTHDSQSVVSVQGLPGLATSVTAGDGYSCALVNESVYCWGNNMFGQLGGAVTGSLVPVQVAFP